MDENKIALVTGASKGIGAAIAIELASEGYDIWLNYRSDHGGAEQVADEIEALGCQCTLVPFDVADGKAAKTALEPLLDEATPFALINNAGFNQDMLMVWMGNAEWNGVLDVHLGGFFNVTKPVLTEMLKKKRGRIINIVSTSGQTGMAGQVNYSAAKAGLIGATRSLAAEVAKRKVLVNAVSPGFIETEMIANLPKDQIIRHIPLGRVGTAAEVSGMVAFLCSDKATYITGQVISINGGSFMG
ncbi:MAG: 3-oxoacyl-ACP reductase FabG [Desulfuromonadales bacterium]|nr:3-oxoacyl-ACP reductase FabG [Desulfuromonadales bacterium]MDT8423117.1 3-oxoacyl-ACP reductase FabG [Desulfuromonadales bacterium]